MPEYNGIDKVYIIVGSVGIGIGTGLIINGLTTSSMENILGGIGILYGANYFRKAADDNANAREQIDILKGIEAKLGK